MKELRKKSFKNGVVYCLQLEDGFLVETTDTFLPYYTKDAIGRHQNKLDNNELGDRTNAVFEGRKTQTRRILNPTLLFQRQNTYEGWEKGNIADWKQSCKDRLYKAEGEELKKNA